MKTLKFILLFMSAAIGAVLVAAAVARDAHTERATISIPQGANPADAARQAVAKAATRDNADWHGFQIKSIRDNALVACQPMRTDECFTAVVTAKGDKLIVTSTGVSGISDEKNLANGGIWMLTLPLGVQQ